MKNKTHFLYAVSFVTRLLGLLVIVIILIEVLSLFFSRFDDVNSYSYINQLILADDAIRASLRGAIPTVIGGRDISVWIILVFGVILKVVFSEFNENIKERIKYIEDGRSHSGYSGSPKEKSAVQLLYFMQRCASAILGNRIIHSYKQMRVRRLMNRLNQVQEKLDNMGRELTFLSIGIVEFKRFAKDEDPLAIDHSFEEYKKFVRKSLKKHNYLKAAWDKEKVISCFSSFESAFKAAQDVINKLPDFNEEFKTTFPDLFVRCGISSGFVYYDEKLSLRDMKNRALDLSSHIQKLAEPNTIYAFKRSIKPDELVSSFEPTYKTVEEQQIFVWGNRISV